MARSTLRTRLFVTEFEDRVVPATVSERIAQAQREAAEAAARNQALLDAQIAAAAEIARIALTTAKDRNEAGEVVLTDDFGNVRRAVRVLADGYTGGAWVAVADVNGDGAPDYLSAPGKGAAPLVKVTDGTTGN